MIVVNMMAFGADLGFAGRKVGRRMRVGTRFFGFVCEFLLISMAAKACCVRRR